MRESAVLHSMKTKIISYNRSAHITGRFVRKFFTCLKQKKSIILMAFQREHRVLSERFTIKQAVERRASTTKLPVPIPNAAAPVKPKNPFDETVLADPLNMDLANIVVTEYFENVCRNYCKLQTLIYWT